MRGQSNLWEGNANLVNTSQLFFLKSTLAGIPFWYGTT